MGQTVLEIIDIRSDVEMNENDMNNQSVVQSVSPSNLSSSKSNDRKIKQTKVRKKKIKSIGEYKCKISKCSKAYTTKSSLNRHLKDFHKLKPDFTPICEQQQQEEEEEDESDSSDESFIQKTKPDVIDLTNFDKELTPQQTQIYTKKINDSIDAVQKAKKMKNKISNAIDAILPRLSFSNKIKQEQLLLSQIIRKQSLSPSPRIRKRPFFKQEQVQNISPSTQTHSSLSSNFSLPIQSLIKPENTIKHLTFDNLPNFLNNDNHNTMHSVIVPCPFSNEYKNGNHHSLQPLALNKIANRISIDSDLYRFESTLKNQYDTNYSIDA